MYNVVMSKIIEVNLEIPRHSNIKYEYDRKSGQIVVDRILREPFVYPTNYGYVDKTLDWDGDELDVLIYSPEQFLPGAVLRARIVGAMRMVDDGEIDTKLIAIHADDYRLGHIQKLDDLPSEFLNEIEIFFSTYKNWKRPNITSVEGFENEIWALGELAACQKLFKDYGDLPKSEFIAQMRKKHPTKYPKEKTA